MTKLNKTEGAEESCPTCHKTIVCRTVEYKGNKKLQWQDPNGGAHYLYDRETGKTSCKGNAENVAYSKEVGRTVQSKGEIHLEQIDIPLETLDELRGETEAMLKFQLARLYYIQEGLRNRGIDATPAFVGMLYNQQMATLREELK